MKFAAALLLLMCAWKLPAQTGCSRVEAMAPCEVTFELTAAEAAAHPDRAVEMSVEFRSPSHNTYLAPVFWAGGSRMATRIAPDEPGSWDYRVSGNLARFEGKTGQFAVTAGTLPGFVQPANVFHFWTVPGKKPHLWMGYVAPSRLDAARYESLAATRAQQHFNHVRISVLDGAQGVFSAGELKNPGWFDLIDAAVFAANRHGITADLVLAGPNGQLTQLFPDHESRVRYVKYLCARYGGLNITWLGIEQFETYPDGRQLLSEIAETIARYDGHHHPMSEAAQVTSGPLAADRWMKFLTYRTANPAIGFIERQFFALPAIIDFNADGNQDLTTFRTRLWNSTMNGQYPEATVPSEAAAQLMKIWYDFFSQTRHWELSPFFDVQGGRAMGLDEVEYVVYVEKPGPVQLTFDQKHKYDMHWINPLTGETSDFKPLKAEKIGGEPPDNSHDWVLSVARDSRKASMAKSYYFESKTPDVQEIDSDPAKLPFELELPDAKQALSVSHPVPYRIKLRRETKAAKAMQYLITGEVSAAGQGYRVLAIGASGTLQIPPDIVQRYPALLHVRVEAVNGVGKAYSLDQNFSLVP